MSSQLGTIGGKLSRRLRDPFQLRIAVGGAILLGWYFAVFSPLEAGITKATSDREKSHARLTMAQEIEALRTECKKIQNRLPGKTDPNEWVEYFLEGVRKFPLRLLKLEPKGVRQLGPLEVITLRIDLQGTHADLDAMLGWIEANPRLLRIDSVVIEPPRGGGTGLIMTLTVLGVMG